MRITRTFAEVASTDTYLVKCDDCGRTLRRTAKVYQTLNPFNKNAAGEVKTQSEIRAENRERLPAEIAKLKAAGATCKTCIERPRRSLLLWFEGDLEKPYQHPHKGYYNSPANWLVDRRHLRIVYNQGDGGRYVLYLTPAGQQRAESFTAKERADVAPVPIFEFDE